MLNEICGEIKNYFCHKKIFGDFKVEDGAITPPVNVLENRYYRIVGSVFNDGVHAWDDHLMDEPEFHGAIWLLNIPQEVIELADEIRKWQADNEKVMTSPYTSESFGGYSYSLGGNADGTNGTDWTKQASFMTRLNRYRKVRAI